MPLQAAFYRTLAAYHRAGISWPDAVESAAGSQADVREVAGQLRQGTSLADALGGHADPVDRALIRAGEASGQLESALERIAEAHEDSTRERRERWAGLAYPIILAHVGALLLPLPDLLQGNIGTALLWSLAILVPIWSWILGIKYVDAKARHESETPMATWGPFRNAAAEGSARCLRVLAACDAAGVPLLEGLALARSVSPGSPAGQDLARAEVLANQGSALAPAWQDLAASHADRLRAAEHVGELGIASKRVARDLADDVRIRRKKTAAILPIVVLLSVGAVIAWRIFSFYGNLYGPLAR